MIINVEGSEFVNFSIQYFLPLRGNEGQYYSPFQGFSFGLLESLEFLTKILKLPANIFEYFADVEQKISFKLNYSSGHSIMPFNEDLLDYLPISKFAPFICIFSDQFTSTKISNFVKKNNIPILHVTTTKDKGAIPLQSLDRETFLCHFKNVINFLRGNIPDATFKYLAALISQTPIHETKEINICRKNHYATYPGEMLLENINYNFTRNENIVSNTNEKYIEAIIELANFIRMLRVEISKKFEIPNGSGVEVIVTEPSMYLSIIKSKFHKKSSDLNEKKLIKTISEILRLFQKQDEIYFDTQN